jgi:hypothetical protein
MLEVYHRSLLVYRKIDTDPVLPAAVTDDDERKADDEPDVDAPAPSPEARPNRAAPVLQPCAVKTCDENLRHARTKPPPGTNQR